MIRYLKALMLLAATFCLLSAGAFFAHLQATLDKVDGLVADSRALVTETQTRMVGTSQNLNAVLIQAGLASDNLRRASESQAAVSTKTMEILDHADQLIVSTQGDVNDVAAHSAVALDSLLPVMASLNKSAIDLDKLANDPAIAETFKSVQVSTANVAKTTDNIYVMSNDAKTALEKALKPAALWKRIIEGALEIGAGVKNTITIF